MTEIKISNDGITAKLQALQSKMSDLSSLMKEISDIMFRSVEKNSQASGRPPWKALSQSTLAARRVFPASAGMNRMI
jgi:phage gpG-like protein